jgi:outer membrane protein OmpA-like peptidoglycan-associated protein
VTPARTDTARAATPDTAKKVDSVRVTKPDSVKAAKPDSAKPVPKSSARVIILPGTIWNYRSSAINATGLPGLDSVATLLRGNASLVAEVQGYAHDRLVPADNNLLSQRRAEAIKSYIVSKGVTPERLTAIGMGSQTLIVSDTTDSARITNRRVEVHVRPKP